MKAAAAKPNGVRRKVTITIKDMPAGLHRELKNRASLSGRSLNTEVLACLEAQTRSQRINPEAFLARARAFRATLNLELAPGDWESARREGQK
jgi:plasmid stability protein